MTFNSIVLPVCLPPPLKDHTDQTATLTGWGRKWNDGPLSDQLNEVSKTYLERKGVIWLDPKFSICE